MDFVLIFILACFVLFMAGRILEKAGFAWSYCFLLLVPIVNIGMIWVFAFKKWPNLRADIEQDLR